MAVALLKLYLRPAAPDRLKGDDLVCAEVDGADIVVPPTGDEHAIRVIDDPWTQLLRIRSTDRFHPGAPKNYIEPITCARGVRVQIHDRGSR